MKNSTTLKKWGWLPLMFLLIVATIISAITLIAKDSEETLFNLNEREIVLAVDESQKVELESEKVNVKTAKLTVSWKSSKPSVASVDEDGSIKAASGGETKVTAVVEYKGKEYSTSCVVTVKDEEHKYSTYKIRWFTQTEDRSDYEIKEETFEREVGSAVELTELDAKKNLPKQYVFNKGKSTLHGTVKSRLGVCVLEVYFDVAEVSYSVDYYYESADNLGTYTEKETKNYKAYAFTKVGVTEKCKAGFVRNDKVKGTVLSNSSVTAGAKLKVYCDRIRANVTINYISGRPSATYQNIYGIGLIDAPEDALTDSVEYKTATYVNGNKKKATMALLKTAKGDVTIDFKLDGVGFTYALKDGVSTIKNECSEKATPCYAVLKGKSNVLYLSADYLLTGSTSNKFGITLSDGTTSREIRFKIAASRKSAGVMIKMDNTTKGGLLTEKDTSNTYDYTCDYNSEMFVWAQNYDTKSKTDSSIIKNMLLDKDGGTYQIQWAVYEGVLYARIEDQTVLRLPLNRLNTKWNAKTKFEIGISSYDAAGWNDELQVTNVSLKTGDAAKNVLKTDGQLAGEIHRMGYDVISGSYIPGSGDKNGNIAYAYSAEAVNTGISTNVKWVDVNNSLSSAGISVKVGEESYQYVIRGNNDIIRRLKGEGWNNDTNITEQITAIATPFNEQGEAKIDAFVKNGYLYILYNGVEAQCINMLSLFPEYKADTKVSVGIFTWKPSTGLATFSDTKELNEAGIAQVCSANGVKEWGYYVEPTSKYTHQVVYDFADGSVEPERWNSGWIKTGILNFMGENTTWQVEGSFERPVADEDDMYVGFRIKSGDKQTLIFGSKNGFQQNTIEIDGLAYQEYSDFAPSVYSFNNIVSTKFFNLDGTENIQSELGFRAVIYNDIFYVWVTDENGNTGLCWRIPLTEKQFGEFEAGSEYQIAVYFEDGSKGHTTATNLKVKMGYQVTDQENFTKDEKNKKYGFTDAIAEIEKNIAAIISDKEDGEFSFYTQNIGGNLAEIRLNRSWALAYDKNGQPDSKKVDYDALENKLTIDHSSDNKNNTQAYFKATDKTQVITGTFELGAQDNTNVITYGITVKSGGKSAQIVARRDNRPNTDPVDDVRIMLNEAWVPSTAFSVQSEVTKAVPTWSNPYEDNELNVMAIADRGALYMYFDEQMIGSLDLYQMLPGYEEGDDVQLGVYGWSVKLAPTTVVTGLSQVIGEDAKAYMTANNITLTDEHVWRIFRDGNALKRGGLSLTKMTYSNGVYDTKDSTNGTATYMYNAETKMDQKLEATVTLTDASTATASYGFTIKSSHGNRQVLIQAKSGELRLMKNYTWNTVKTYPVNGTTKLNLLGIGQYKTLTPPSYRMTVMIKGDNLYIMLNGNENYLTYIPLTDFWTNYTSEDAVALGLSGWSPKTGPAQFTNVSFTAGSKAISDEMETKLNTAKYWKIN